MRFGLLLPHFGTHASGSRLVSGARRAERLGFASIWARDHIVYRPHAFEDTDPAFLETFITLAWVAGQTEGLAVGTAAAIPTRHPAHLAQIVATVSNLLGPNRVVLGIGLGGSEEEFEAIGLSGLSRAELVRQQARVCSELWAGETVSFENEAFMARDVSISPQPAGKVPLLYAGGTPAAVRRAAESFDGLLPGRITVLTLERRLADLRERFAARDAEPIVGVVPLTSIAEDDRAALDGVDVDSLLVNANRQRFWVKPPSGQFSSVRDLDGSLLAGSPETIVTGVRRLSSLGVEHAVFDLRLRFDDWEDQIELLGRHVLPAVVHD